MLISICEAAKELNCSAENLRRQIRAGLLPVYKVGPRTTRVDIDELRKLARRERVDDDSHPPKAA